MICSLYNFHNSIITESDDSMVMIPRLWFELRLTMLRVTNLFMYVRMYVCITNESTLVKIHRNLWIYKDEW